MMSKNKKEFYHNNTNTYTKFLFLRNVLQETKPFCIDGHQNPCFIALRSYTERGD